MVENKAALFDAGLPGPLPQMISEVAYWVPVVVAVLVLVDAAKVVYRLVTKGHESPPPAGA